MGNFRVNPVRIFIRFLILVSFSITAIILGGYAAFLVYQSVFAVPNVRVPSVLEMELDAARQTLYKTGLKMAVVDDNIFQEGERYIAVKQNPAAGTVIKKNRTVEVEVRTAKTFKRVPDLAGKTISEAEVILLEYGFQVGSIAYALHQTLPEGMIIAQEPMAGEDKNNSGRVNILVSNGAY